MLSNLSVAAFKTGYTRFWAQYYTKHIRTSSAAPLLHICMAMGVTGIMVEGWDVMKNHGPKTAGHGHH